MFESAIINALGADAELCSYVSTFETRPAIFAEIAPEKAVMPYIVFRIDRSDKVDVVESAIVMVDYYAYDRSRTNSRKAAERIEYLLDMRVLNHPRYDRIDVDFFAASPVPEADARDIHYNMQFQARMVRSKWTTETH
jgi:hypothetical protein